MRVLGSTVLVFEWLIVALAVPVAVNTADVRVGVAWGFLGLITVLVIVAIARITTPVGVAVGWSVQVVTVAAAFVVPLVPLAILGIIFAGLYYAAIRLAQRVDAARARPPAGPPAANGRDAVGHTGDPGGEPDPAT